MGLDTSHGCWHGPYSSFNTWRRAVAKAIGIPDLDEHWRKLMDETYCQPKRPLMILLNHSDCDGKIESKDCGPIADDLETVLDDLPQGGPFSPLAMAWQWIKGLRAASAAGEDVIFH